MNKMSTGKFLQYPNIWSLSIFHTSHHSKNDLKLKRLGLVWITLRARVCKITPVASVRDVVDQMSFFQSTWNSFYVFCYVYHHSHHQSGSLYYHYPTNGLVVVSTQSVLIVLTPATKTVVSCRNESVDDVNLWMVYFFTFTIPFTECSVCVDYVKTENLKIRLNNVTISLEIDMCPSPSKPSTYIYIHCTKLGMHSNFCFW